MTRGRAARPMAQFTTDIWDSANNINILQLDIEYLRGWGAKGGRRTVQRLDLGDTKITTSTSLAKSYMYVIYCFNSGSFLPLRVPTGKNLILSSSSLVSSVPHTRKDKSYPLSQLR